MLVQDRPSNQMKLGCQRRVHAAAAWSAQLRSTIMTIYEYKVEVGGLAVADLVSPSGRSFETTGRLDKAAHRSVPLIGIDTDFSSRARKRLAEPLHLTRPLVLACL
jgi:hypothetical protein